MALKFFPVTPVCHIHRLRGPHFATGQRSSNLRSPTPTTISGVLWLQPIIPYQLLTTQGSFALEPSGIDKQGLPYSMQQQDRERQEILHWLAYLCLKSLFLTEDRRAGNRREKEVLAAGLDALLAAENLTATLLYNTVINKDLAAMTLIHFILDTLSVRSLTNSYTAQKGPSSTCTLLLALGRT